MKSTVMILLWSILFSSLILLAQENPNLPYTADANTVLLLHFDGNLDNAASTGGTVTAHGNISFEAGKFGQAVRLNNTTVVINDTTFALTDSAYISVDGIAGLNLTGDWTVEGWFRYGDTTAFYGANDPAYLVSRRDTTGNLNYGVFTNLAPVGPPPASRVMGSYTSLESQPAFVPGASVGVRFEDPQTLASRQSELVSQWLHFTFIRVTSARALVMVIHDESGNLLFHHSWGYHFRHDTPVTSTLPLLLGRLAEGADGFFNGWIDEIRISNVARHFDLPPSINPLAFFSQQLVNPWQKFIQNASATDTEYPFEADIFVPGTASGVQSAAIYYRTIDYQNNQYEKVARDDPSWQTVAMSPVGGDSWRGAIPQQPGGTAIQFFVRASSTTGKTKDIGTLADSTYQSFGVYIAGEDTVLHLDFEEDDLNFTDKSAYNHQLNAAGQWAIWDDPADVPQGEFAAFFIDGNFPIGEIVSPFLSLQEYTLDYWWKADAVGGNANQYQVSYIPGANLEDPLSTREVFGNTNGSDGSGAFTSGQWFIDNYALLWRGQPPNKNFGNDTYILDIDGASGIAWQWGSSSISTGEDPVGKWYHVHTALSRDQLQVVVWEGLPGEEVQLDNVILNRGTDILVVDDDRLTPYTAGIGKLRIGPAAIAPPNVHPFLEGKMDNLVLTNNADIIVGIGENDEDGAAPIIEEYRLSQNYPNPFNPETTIRFNVPKSVDLTLKVYDLLGRLVKTLHEGRIAAGEHEVVWDGTNDLGQEVSTGIYYYQMSTKGFTRTHRMVLLK